ncbi:hypothetical protein Spith_0213 [Spirochaeta thermophila DSM 6578]|uniref:DUF4037 domain-containing protein n=1 Tax=Winmispira thermophila (strain ATCC 700085 / DSM 6578 / Z-1203) TaxID=869211 RepID=G0GCT1_WINT7|nr:DUF4037 domain-containing protein [Spirochaeta thermophila]AEJ60500.1 hypothetical protein Spith_0213 [Spirochaeta thermophila DSM 6578]
MGGPMRMKVEAVLERLVEVLSRWDAVDTVCFLDRDREDIYDPYFFISLDVYFSGELPSYKERMEELSFTGAFESAPGNRKDRFLVGDLPVRLEYKSIPDVEAVLGAEPGAFELVEDRVSYMFYRLVNGTILFSRSDWLASVRERLEDLPSSFWRVLRDEARAKMEHFLSDLCAAAALEDEYFFLVSASGFIQSVCAVLFAVNRRFEPGGREMERHVFSLPQLPYSFKGYFQQFVRYSHDFPMEKKREIAENLARHVVKMCLADEGS